MFHRETSTNRRKFLERSALGAGSLLFSSTLLGSCTDHLISEQPKPQPPPGLGATEIDWNDDAKAAVIFGVGMIPEAGEVLGLLLDIFWPASNEDVWGQVKAQVEALIDQKIADNVYLTVGGDLDGLKKVTHNYVTEIAGGNPDDQRVQWVTTKNFFDNALPHFQSPGYELLLLPLFAQYANMYLAVLRDGVIKGQAWGRSAADQAQDLTNLTTSIDQFTTYASTTYSNGRINVSNAAPRDPHACEPFRTINRYDRQMTDTVLDFMDSWAYYDISKYPNGVYALPSREIFSDPYGSFSNAGPIVTSSPPTQWPSTITVWAYDQLDAVQVTYPAGGGPGGVTQTRRMGDQYGGSNQPPHGGVVSVPPSNLVIAARTTYNNDVPYTLQFIFADYTTTPVYGGSGQQGYGPNDSGWVGYPYYAVSSIYATGPSTYPSAESVVFGYKVWESPPLLKSAVEAIYVKSPVERSAADLAKAFPNFAGLGSLITAELKAARAAYWASIEARAK